MQGFGPMRTVQGYNAYAALKRLEDDAFLLQMALVNMIDFSLGQLTPLGIEILESVKQHGSKELVNSLKDRLRPIVRVDD